MAEASQELSEPRVQSPAITAHSLFDAGNAAMHAGQVLEARAYYERAIAIDPQYGNAHFNLGATYQAQGLHHLALPYYERGVALMDDPSIYLGNVLNTKMRLCDWQGLDALTAQIESRVLAGQKTCPPFQVVSFTDSLELHRKAAALWLEAMPPLDMPPFQPRQKGRDEKVRIAYLSADLQTHPVAYLVAEMFELHDKTQFEFVAFSNGHAPVNDAYRVRIEAAFDAFIDIRNRSDEEVVMLARQMEIDVVVDLTGLTQGGRVSALMGRMAPVQIEYLGYPSTTTARNVDYMIADKTLVPLHLQQHYSEKMIYLPHCFQVSDSHRTSWDQIARHEDHRLASHMAIGFPEGSFVFCGLCNPYKITPEVFDSWMRILHAVPHGVLLLGNHNEVMQANLRSAAQMRGIDQARLFFGERLIDPSAYLARYTVCDLFLDTFPYNAGSTANDVLRMGLPLLTLAGEAITGRTAASLLHTLGLDDLVTNNWRDYELLAIELATKPERHVAIKQRLLEACKHGPLFDTKRTTCAIERGYAMALERYWQGLAPDHLFVPLDQPKIQP